ncbi:hypothetical protein LOK49_LG11G01665 [Camellia lanceoleosa]|uniref:Uncharacterized protein n=1 Tax=Camellia lanceoleosa TaxID=1840588 RepID=A0ACC0G2P0_9ERIC|nr:hypothetical protein LOK49_LG11G01665 [Camellia lanceoleosa]
MDVDNEMENLVPQVENRSSSPHHPQLDFSSTRNSENTIQVEEGNNDILMERVEFMARNQYERYHYEGEKVLTSQGKLMEKGMSS